ncbi:MAG: hypothetical protein Ta2B_17590 [Termitinemataceae bacterium]|nr:MAG: hypothetical protein Ta2B_17590 [Termitinemataceae bacterium]
MSSPLYSYTYCIPYIAIFLLFVFWSFSIHTKSNAINIGYTMLQRYAVGAVFIVFIALRGFVETDWVNYYPLYQDAPSLFGNTDVIKYLEGFGSEQLFYVYTVLCKTVSENYFFFQALSSIIDFFIIYYFFTTYIPGYPVLGFVFFFIFSGIEMEFNLLRDAKSIMLFLISIQYIKKRKILRYVLCNIIGSFFHVSSLLYIPLYFFLHKRIHKAVIFIIFLFGHVLFLTGTMWLKGLLVLISGISDNRLFLLIQRYLANDYYSREWGVGIGYFERLLYFLLIFILYDKLLKKSESNILFVNLAFIYWILYLYCAEMYIIMRRIPILFVCSLWVLFPHIYSILSKQLKYIFILLLLIYGPLKLSFNHGVNALYESAFTHSNYAQRAALTQRITADVVRAAGK